MSAHELQRIQGLGAGYANKLIGLDVEELEDIATWSDAEVDAMDAKIKANGAIKEQDWRGQARKILGMDPYVPSKAEQDAEQGGEAPNPEPGDEPHEPDAIKDAAKASDERAAEKQAAGRKAAEVLGTDTNPAPAKAGFASKFERKQAEQADLASIAAAFDPANPLAGLSDEQRIAVMSMVADARAYNAAQPQQSRPSAKSSKAYRRLDRNKKFAAISGNFHGAHFSQNINGETFYFDHEGKEIPWDREGNVPILRPVAGADSYEDEHTLGMDDARYFHVLNWLDRKVDYPLPLVLKGIQELYGKRLKDEKEARTFLHFIRRTPGL